MCTRLDQIKARPESPVDALLQEIRDARIRLPQPADGTHLDKYVGYLLAGILLLLICT